MPSPTPRAPRAPQRPQAATAHALIDEAYLAFHAAPSPLALERLVALSQMALALEAIQWCELPCFAGGVQ